MTSDSKKQIVLIGVTTLSLMGGTFLYGCGSEAGESGQKVSQAGITSGESGESGEIPSSSSSGGGESGESGDVSIDLGKDDVAYLAQLWTIRGHLEVAHKLYQLKDPGAVTHANHPNEEILPRLQSALTARHAEPLSLAAYQQAGQGKDVNAEETAYRDIIASLDRNISKIGASITQQAQVIAEISRRAAKEYDQGVNDNTVANREEFQDGYGFVRAIEELIAQLPAKEENKGSLDKIHREIAALVPAWSSLAAGGSTMISDSQFAGRMARIEIAAGNLKN